MARLDVAALPGDGIGPEVTRAALEVLHLVATVGGHELRVTEWPIGWAAIEAGRGPLPDETRDACRAAPAVLVGAVGDPRAGDRPLAERPVTGLLALRRALGCFVNVRPARVSEGHLRFSALRAERARGVDLVFVRELAGGLYYGEPRALDGAEGRAWNTLRYEAEEIERIARFAFETARARRGRLTSVDKANVLETFRLWRATVDRVATDFPDVELEHMLIDRAAMELMVRPAQFDTVLTSNLLGDILSDQAAGVVGSLGLLGSASLGGESDLYEPVHGSAPDLVGTDRANPIGAIASVALMLRHTFDLVEEAALIERAIDAVLAAGHHTADLSSPDGDPTQALGTTALTKRILARVREATPAPA
ncbi:MAG: 3-isopropylmalate dehydrogenase [Gemmatimonadetes bacterium]|nr:3-isopropylmalate dehydrogenase [Gemmatimonadota bacterium]